MRDKTESYTAETSEQSQPFFARFLEGQDSSKNSFQTLKFPSDSDEVVWVLDYASDSNVRER